MTAYHGVGIAPAAVARGRWRGLAALAAEAGREREPQASRRAPQPARGARRRAAHAGRVLDDARQQRRRRRR